jgi:hypothetical protein
MHCGLEDIIHMVFHDDMIAVAAYAISACEESRVCVIVAARG